MVKKKNEVKMKFRVVPIVTFSFAGLCLLAGWSFGDKGDWVFFGSYSIAAVILTMLAAAVLICQTLEKRFDRLEKLISGQ